jgi:hypothetical protein
MALNLVEAAKLAANNGETKKAAVIEIFAAESDLLRVMPMLSIAGNSYAYNVEGTLPGIAFRGINGSFTESTGVINPQTEALKIAGGDLDVDTALIKTMGASVRGYHEAAKARALAREISYILIEGAAATTPAEFDGLKARVPTTGSQAVSNDGSGEALSMRKLDETIDKVDGATHIIMNKAMLRNIKTFLRAGSTAVEMMEDDFGRPLLSYAGLPILVADRNGDRAALGFTESSSTTSIFVVNLGVNTYHGIQNGGIEVRDLGELQTAPKFRTRVEWMCGQVIEHPRAVARLHNIKNLQAVA